MAKAKEGKAKATPWGSGFGRAPEILHGAPISGAGAPCRRCQAPGRLLTEQQTSSVAACTSTSLCAHPVPPSLGQHAVRRMHGTKRPQQYLHSPAHPLPHPTPGRLQQEGQGQDGRGAAGHAGSRQGGQVLQVAAACMHGRTAGEQLQMCSDAPAQLYLLAARQTCRAVAPLPRSCLPLPALLTLLLLCVCA